LGDVLNYINVNDYISSISYFPSGDRIAVGSFLGNVSIYKCFPKIEYLYSFDAKMRKYEGKKVTNIEFLSNEKILVTTNDSRIRILNVYDGKLIKKYKGFKNEKSLLKANYLEMGDCVICPSDTKYVYVWDRDSSYEYFKPYSEKTNISMFANDAIFSNYLRKITDLNIDLCVKEIILNFSESGKMQILINIDIL
jgi:WD40 repeat protein